MLGRANKEDWRGLQVNVLEALWCFVEDWFFFNAVLVTNCDQSLGTTPPTQILDMKREAE